MYRDASESLLQTIARLEGELRACRAAVRSSRREQRLVAVTGLSMVVAVVAVAACAAAYARAEAFERLHDERLDHLVDQNLRLRRGIAQCNQQVDDSERARARCEQACGPREQGRGLGCFRLTECGDDPW